MKYRLLAGCAFGVAAAFGSASNHEVRYGPKDCVSVTRSHNGTCMLGTNCQGQDTSKLEFAFDCQSSKGDVVRHSFGLGGFDDVEEYDTEISCAKCKLPTALNKVEAQASKDGTGSRTLLSRNKPESKSSSSMVQAKRQTKQSTAATKAKVGVSTFGPQACFSTWRNSDGHCVLQTRCRNVDISKYEVGFICVNSDAKPQKHMFGRSSFDAEETFDTLVPCAKCEGLETQGGTTPKQDDTEVALLEQEVEELSGGMKSLLDRVAWLKAQVAVQHKSQKAVLAKATVHQVVTSQVQHQAAAKAKQTKQTRHVVSSDDQGDSQEEEDSTGADDNDSDDDQWTKEGAAAATTKQQQSSSSDVDEGDADIEDLA